MTSNDAMLSIMKDPGDGDAALAKAGAQAMEIATTRAAQEVQAAMVVAKKFPRDLNASYARIMQACKRKGLAEQAIYEFPRGGTKVNGPSIRLAETLAQNWGNMDFGIVELSRSGQESQVMAYAWDLETNARQTKVFAVPHSRDTREGKVPLRDDRDVYELVANMGARRLRACILGIIPGDIVDDAVAECEKTLAGDNAIPLADRVRQMVVGFASLGVTQAMIETRLGHNLDATTESEIAKLRKVFASIKDGMGSVDDFFRAPVAATKAADKPKTLDDVAAKVKTSRDQDALDNPKDEE